MEDSFAFSAFIRDKSSFGTKLKSRGLVFSLIITYIEFLVQSIVELCAKQRYLRRGSGPILYTCYLACTLFTDHPRQALYIITIPYACLYVCLSVGKFLIR